MNADKNHQRQARRPENEPASRPESPRAGTSGEGTVWLAAPPAGRRWLRDLPIKRKLLVVTLATCGAALALACAALFWFQSVNFRRAFAAELESIAAIVAHNSSAPLAFDDKKSAVEVLSALKVKPHITSARVFDSQGGLFAHFGPDAGSRSVNGLDTTIPLTDPKTGEGVTFDRGYASLSLPVELQDARPGRLHLRARFEDKYRELLSLYGTVLAAVLAGSLVVILIITSFMQRIITAPIAALAAVARNVSEKEDYATRAPEAGRDEVGLLTRAFNRMLDQIQARDRELRESRQRFEVAVMGSSDGLWDWNLATQEVYFSPRWKSMLGYADEEMPNDLAEWESRLHPDDLDPTLRKVKDYLAGDAPAYEIEFRLRHKDGSYRWILSRGAALWDKPGQPFRFAGSHTDITARKDAQAEMARLNRELVDASRQAGMAEIATGVLHNVGNVLNSVNVSATLVLERLKKSKISSLGKSVVLLREHRDHLGQFLTTDPKGSKLPGFLEALAAHLAGEQAALVQEVESLQQNVDHIKQIVAMQQAFAKVSGVLEPVSLRSLVEDALRMAAAGLQRHQIEIVRDFAEAPPVVTDRHKVLQILVNLISNAKHALEARPEGRRLTLRVSRDDDQSVRVEVADNGAGIARENLTRIFQHGFTTKKQGHGFGLHSGANAAQELGGSLTAHSDGPGHGASFTLNLPVQPAREALEAA